MSTQAYHTGVSLLHCLRSNFVNKCFGFIGGHTRHCFMLLPLAYTIGGRGGGINGGGHNFAYHQIRTTDNYFCFGCYVQTTCGFYVCSYHDDQPFCNFMRGKKMNKTVESYLEYGIISKFLFLIGINFCLWGYFSCFVLFFSSFHVLCFPFLGGKTPPTSTPK